MFEELTFKEWIILCVLGLLGGGFSLAIALSIGYISIFRDVPRKVFWLAIFVQVALSLGCFIGASLFFYSNLTPESLPKDFVTGAFIAYTASAMPELTFGIVVLCIKIVKENLKKTFNFDKDSSPTPDIKLRSIIDSYRENNPPDTHIKDTRMQEGDTTP